MQLNVAEVWRKHPRFDFVSVSNTGRVRNDVYGTVYAATPDKDGYSHCCPRCRGVRITMKVHRAVAETFIGDIRGMDVNHLNGVKNDNRVENLQICTKSENHIHAREVLGVLVGERSGTAKITDQQSLEMIIRYRSGESIKSLASAFGLSARGTRHIVNRTRRRHVKCIEEGLKALALGYSDLEHAKAANRLASDLLN